MWGGSWVFLKHRRIKKKGIDVILEEEKESWPHLVD